MNWNFAVNLVGCVSAVGCVGAIPLWILGVPGTDGAYARGWAMGFQVLWTYPAAFVANWIIFRLLGRLFQAGWLDWSTIGGWSTLVLLTLASLRMVQALRTMP